MAEKRVKILADNEPVWIMCSEAGASKKRLENNINRRTSLINDMTSLIDIVSEVIENNGQQRDASATLVYVADDIPELLKANFEAVTQYINILKNVKVYEVNVKDKDEQVFNNTLGRFGTLDDFIEYALTAVRDQHIDSIDPKDKNAHILKSLRAENLGLLDKVSLLEKELKEKEEELIVYSKKVVTLTNKEEKEYLPEITRYKEYIEELEAKIKRIELDLEIAKKKSKEYLNEKDKIFGQKEEILAENLGLSGTLDEKETEIFNLKTDIKKLEEESREQYLKQEQIINSRVDSESMTILENDIRDLTAKLEELKKTNSRYFQEAQTEKTKNVRLNKQMEEMRKSASILEDIGRTEIIESITLKNTEIVYVKLFNDLPFHRKALKNLYEKIKTEKNFRNSKMLILKHDEKFDKEFFYNVPLYGTMQNVDDDAEVFRLLPSSYMATGTENLEKTIDFLFVVDYIQNNEYYVDTYGKKFYMTFVQEDSYMEDYDLKGFKISYSTKSLYDIHYSVEIATNRDRKLREKLLSLKVNNWYDNMELNGF